MTSPTEWSDHLEDLQRPKEFPWFGLQDNTSTGKTRIL